MEQVFQVVLMAWAVTAVLMLLLWWAQVKTTNAAWVDIGWTFGFALTAIIYFNGLPGWGFRKAVLLGMAILWAMRLGLMLIVRLINDPSEDRRYAKIRAEWKTGQNLKFFFFFQFQALLDILLAICFMPSMLNTTEGFSVVELLAIVLWLVGFFGETLADNQLKAFKAEETNKGKTCQAGLWNYSRHPNYFFEWLMWAAYAVFALASPFGWVALIAPVLMYYFLMHVSGVPLAEAQSLKTRGEAYLHYQATTSIFIPWFKSSSPPLEGGARGGGI